MKTIAIPLGGKLAQESRYAYTWVDEDSFELVKFNRWTAMRGSTNRPVYAYRYAKPHFLHQLVCVTENQVDHISRNGLDNRKCNLRVATGSQNSANNTRPRGVSGFRGVTPRQGRWAAQIARGDGKGQAFLGYFDTAIEAAVAYDEAAKTKWGQFAGLNFPDQSLVVPPPIEIIYVQRPPVVQTHSKAIYKGVAWKKGSWASQIAIPGQHRMAVIAYFQNPHFAALAYNEEALKLLGEFAVLNVVPQEWITRWNAGER